MLKEIEQVHKRYGKLPDSAQTNGLFIFSPSLTEVHPFLDGNGRIAPVMMNAELSARGLSKIIIPTVYREDYMGALRKLTRQRVADAYVRMLLRAYEFSSTLVGENIDEMENHLIECDAFKEPKEGKLKVTHSS